MTTKEAAQILAVLTAAYPNAYKNMSEMDAAAVALVWAAQFADVPYSIVFMALQKAISKSKFPPTVCEIKERISSLYWEAYEVIRDHEAGQRRLTKEDLAIYRHVYDSTAPFRYNTEGPELKDILPYSQPMLLAGAEGGTQG